jgi:Flp pilus assembly protein CpaB
MRRHPRVLALRLLAVTLALFTARLVATDLATLHRRAADLGALGPVVEARRDLPLGAVVQARDVHVVERHAGQVPKSSVRSLDDAIGKTVVVPLVATAPVLAEHLAPTTRLGTAQLVSVDHVAMRVPSIDGLRPAIGATVRIIASLDPGAILTRGEVGAVIVADGARVLAVDGGDDGHELGVLVEVRSDEAPRVAFAAANGVLTLALLPPEDACCVDELPSSRASSEPAS